MKSFLNYTITNRNTYAKWVFGYFIVLLIYRWHSSTFLVYTFGQPMKGPDLDYSYWISLCMGFPHYIIHHYWACLVVDAAVIFFSFACFVSDKYRNLSCILLILFFFIQRVTIETFSCSHSKSMSCVFIAILPFCFKKELNFKLMVEAGRYFLIYVMVASAFQKMHNGVLADPLNFATVLVNQHSDLATLNPGHISYRIASKLIAHPAWAAFSYILLFLTQASFMVGIFTKKYDRLLFILLAGFAISTYYIMRIYNFDIVLLGLSLFCFTIGKGVKKSKYAI